MPEIRYRRSTVSLRSESSGNNLYSEEFSDILDHKLPVADLHRGIKTSLNIIHKPIMIFIIDFTISLSKQKRRCSGFDIFLPEASKHVLEVQNAKFSRGRTHSPPSFFFF